MITKKMHTFTMSLLCLVTLAVAAPAMAADEKQPMSKKEKVVKTLWACTKIGIGGITTFVATGLFIDAKTGHNSYGKPKLCMVALGIADISGLHTIKSGVSDLIDLYKKQ